ncbi:DUF4175 family protein [Parvularcula sp. ZS-1/3]|uniref:DUF4175 family protein n=1 Tax=Parvularcula mediterranea TaxID=2732508 RepID=A0A7Y3RM25_9PROT|nr:DUF4175 family protein [Parvularcula mediterranea]NNU16578.1 DUF4175 family protein [Parvularcula mediterranea]
MKLQIPVPLQRAFAVISWERAVPAFLPFVAALAGVFAVLWSGILAELPLSWHIAGLVVCGAALLATLSRGAAKFRFPRKGETLRRIEERSDLKPGILDSVWARPFARDEEDDPLWIASRERLIQTVGTPKVPLPRIDLAEIDSYRLRWIAPALVVGALALTLGQPDGLRASLQPPLPERQPIVVDAWIEPPAYTGLSPRILKLNRERSSLAAAEGSRLHVRLREQDGSSIRGVLTFQTTDRGKRRIRPEGDDKSQVTLPFEDNGLLTISARGETRQVAIYAIEDRPPEVKLVGEPSTETGIIRLEVETMDDYPLADARLVLSLLGGQKISIDAPMPDEDVAGEPAVIPLPSLTGTPGAYRVEAGDEEHPWAGLLVRGQVEVTDGLGRVAATEPFAITMPERTFYNPLSRAVIEERQKLAMAPSSLLRSSDFFGALTNAPDLFDVRAADHLMLKATAEAVAAARVRDVPDIVEGLWPLAVELEDDGLAYAKARLDAAEEALREALRNGASNEEIAEKISELRQAMNDYIRALADSGYAEGDPQSGDDEYAQSDLDDLLDRMEELSEQGARAEAESLLAQLEALLQSLKLSRGEQEGGSPGEDGTPGQGQGQGSGEGQGGMGEGERALSGTGDIIQKQRELTDQTFSARRGQRGQSGLADEQRELTEELDQLAEGLSDEAGDARGAFEDAKETMERAAQALENGNLPRAQMLQEQAMQELREAGNELADAIGEGGDDVSEGATDPFGRAYEGDGGQDPEDFGLYDPERIRELIAEIRKRLEDPNLGEAERTYLESLLERF